MSIFGQIKDAIFGHHAAQPHVGQAVPQSPASAMPQMQRQQGTQAQVQQPQPVDVEAVLKSIAQEKGKPDLNYDSSIVDLMKLLGIDSSLANREQLASELGYSGPRDGSAEMNIWLHSAVMKELEKNGGKVPADLKR